MTKKKFSSTYIFLYISILIVAVAVLLGAAALFLQPYKKANIEREQKQQILAAAGYQHLDNQEVISFFKNVAEEKTIKTENETHIYNKVKQKNGDFCLVLPMFGKGMWGDIWGYIAISEDLQTIVGVTFGHKSETPGLGANIVSPDFAAHFSGMKIVDKNGQLVDIQLVKKAYATQQTNNDLHVDAITGATITSLGVQAMMRETLEKYLQILPKNCEQ